MTRQFARVVTKADLEEVVEASLPDKEFCDRIEAEFEQLLPEEKVVILHLACIHHGLVHLSDGTCGR